MPTVITEFRILGFGTTRDECIEVLDRTALDVLTSIGGEPWEMVDDDIKRIPSSVAPALADASGYCYCGVRTFHFKGPAVVMPAQTYHDGFKVQHANE